MLDPYKIVAVFVAIIFATIIFDAVRRALRNRATIRRRLAGIGRPLGPREIVSKKTGHRFIAPPGFGFDLRDFPDFTEVTSDPFHPDWGGTAPGRAATLYERTRTARMNEVIRAADGIGYNDLVQAAIRLGHPEGIAHAYAAEILISEEGGEELPAAMAHTPNVGGEGHPKYQGGNYVEERDIADEMRGLVYYRRSGR